MKSSYIIPYRDDDIRKRNLNIVLNHLKSFNDLEIIVVEQDSNKKIDLDFSIKHIFTKHSGLFNRSWALNVGAKNSTTDILTFADGDILIKQQYYDTVIELCKNFDVVSPMRKLWFLPQDARDYFSNEKATLIGGTNMCGGIVTFKKDKFFEIKGWDECFEGWGCEDSAIMKKVQLFGMSKITLSFELYHLYHKRFNSHSEVKKKQPHFTTNLQILKSIENFTLEQLKENHLDKIKEIGNLSNYNMRIL